MTMRAYLADGWHQLGLFLLGLWLAGWAANCLWGVNVLEYLAEGLRLIAGGSNG